MNIRSDDDRFTGELDNTLIRLSLDGNNKALETLIVRYKDWIYNIAIRMSGNCFDADDITQEVIIKVITKLSTFKFNSNFRTWLYRITVNNFLTTKKRGKENVFLSFDEHKEFFESLGNEELLEKHCANRHMVIEETKTECLLGMLLCLKREERIIFILGGIFGISSKIGSEILEMSEENYRKKLSRVRQDLKNYLENNCSLMNSNNTCKCSKKAKAALEAGYIDPDNLRFTEKTLKSVNDFIRREEIMTEDVFEWRYEKLFKEQPFKIFEESKIIKLINGL